MAVLALPGVARAAAAGAAAVWCAIGDRLLAYSPEGEPRGEAPAPEGLLGLAAAGGTLAAALEPGLVAWLDPESGRERSRAPVGGEPEVGAGGGAIWVVDRASGRARRLADEGVLGEPVEVGPVDRFAPDGERLWWTSRDDTLLRGGPQPVELGGRGPLVACAGSVWVSAGERLVRIGGWDGQPGLPLEAPPAEALACADGVLVGTRFVLDPSIDAGVREIEALEGRLVATAEVAWAFSRERPEATLLRVR
jgi:hypothetical protein